MKKFAAGFILGTIIMVIASQFWGLMPTFLGGRWDVTQPNPLVSNPISLWCDKLTNASEFGNVQVVITKNGQPVSDLAVLLATEKPPLAPYRDGTIVPIPKKACFINTDNKGMGTFRKVPVGTAYLFFNNDVAAYPKRFGGPSSSITQVKIDNNKTSTANIELNSKP